MAKYIWELASWPNFTWNTNLLVRALSEAKKQQGSIFAQAKLLNLSYKNPDQH